MLTRFLQHGLFAYAPHRHATADMQRIAHQVFARPNFNQAASQVANVVHRGLQRAVVAAGDVGIAHAHRDMHGRTCMEFVLRVLTARLIGDCHPRGKEARDNQNRKAVLHGMDIAPGSGSSCGSPRLWHGVLDTSLP